MDFEKYAKLHQNKKQEASGFIPDEWYKTHTMLDALYYYACQKFPVPVIDQALANGNGIELHGTHPNYAKELFESQGYVDVEEISFKNNPNQKPYNHIRPKFFRGKNGKGEEKLLVAVTPGSDYVTHYAEMLRYILASKNVKADEKLSVIRYPSVEKNISLWTGLDKSFVKKKDVVVIGYVEEMRQRLVKSGELTFLGKNENEFYTSIRYKTKDNKVINFLGVKHSFWGNISSKIAHTVCSLGASEILYISKMGTLTKPEDLYERLFVPTKFVTMRHDKFVEKTETLKNSFIKTHPELDSGLHASVPTVLEESFAQRKIAVSDGVQTIDNEVSQIAHTIKEWNKKPFRWNKVKYGSMHFATDYLYNEGESDNNHSLNLSTNRTPEAVAKKEKALNKMAKVLGKHLGIDLDGQKKNYGAHPPKFNNGGKK